MDLCCHRLVMIHELFRIWPLWLHQSLQQQEELTHRHCILKSRESLGLSGFEFGPLDAGPGAAGEPHWIHGDRETEPSWGSAGSRKERRRAAVLVGHFPERAVGQMGKTRNILLFRRR